MGLLDKLGAQSWSFRSFGFEESIARLKELDLTAMEFCSKHLPADADDPGFEQVKATIKETGITVPCFGVNPISDDAEASRKVFEFAKALGIEILTADPTPESFDSLEGLCEEYGIKIAIHNHGPGARYDAVADTLKVVEGRSPLIGACVDTGHALRTPEKPAEVIEKLGDRVISVHLKDWKMGGDETIPGEGDADLVAVARALKSVGFDGPINLEYELSPEDPVDDMKKGLANWREAVAQP